MSNINVFRFKFLINPKSQCDVKELQKSLGTYYIVKNLKVKIKFVEHYSFFLNKGFRPSYL
jgi:hypothetical protein